MDFRIRMGGVLVAVLALAGSSVACSQPVMEEGKGHTTAKLLAPKPLVKVKASPSTKENEGITEWRIFRGRNDVVLSGYGKNGKVVKGLTIGFHQDKKEGPVLRARLLDGSLFAMRHEYEAARTVTNKDVDEDSAKFLYTALGDMRALKTAVTKSPSRFRTLDTSGLFDCGSGIVSILTSALECLKNSGGSAAAAQQCIAAAQSAAELGGLCTGGVDVPFDPTAGGLDPYGDLGAGLPYDPYDPYGNAGAGLPYDPYDPYGNAGAGLPYDPYDPYGNAGAGLPYDPYGTGLGDWGDCDFGDILGGLGGLGGLGDLGLGWDWGLDPFGDGMSCPSCAAAGMGDIWADPYSGQVGYPGDFGADVFDGFGFGF